MILLANVKSNGDTISSFAYSYDNAGNRMSKIYENGDTEMYSYDSLYQLVKVQTKDKMTEYEYDKVGNREKMIITTDDTEVTEYNYNTDNQLLSYNVNETDTICFIYDANGNQIKKITLNDTVNYDFNFENNLTQISAVNDTNVLSFTYSSGINRLSKTTNGQTLKYFYDNNDVLTEYDTNNVVVCRYTTNLRIDDIISAKRGGTVEQYHKDALGSITNLTLSNENISVSYRYSEFGSIESQSSSHQNEYTYTGRQIDREAGLYYYRSRYYNSENGRFVKKDKYYTELLRYYKIFPVKKLYNLFPLYNYVNNRVINRIDPFGLRTVDINIRYDFKNLTMTDEIKNEVQRIFNECLNKKIPCDKKTGKKIHKVNINFISDNAIDKDKLGADHWHFGNPTNIELGLWDDLNYGYGSSDPSGWTARLNSTAIGNYSGTASQDELIGGIIAHEFGHHVLGSSYGHSGSGHIDSSPMMPNSTFSDDVCDELADNLDVD